MIYQITYPLGLSWNDLDEEMQFFVQECSNVLFTGNAIDMTEITNDDNEIVLKFVIDKVQYQTIINNLSVLGIAFVDDVENIYSESLIDLLDMFKVVLNNFNKFDIINMFEPNLNNYMKFMYICIFYLYADWDNFTNNENYEFDEIITNTIRDKCREIR